MRRYSYTMDINRKRRYFKYEEFRHTVYHCRNQEVVEKKRRIEFGNNVNIDNLKEKENQNPN